MDSELYRNITDFAHDMPSWVQHIVEVWTEYGLLLFGVLFVLAWWRARRRDTTSLALALLAPLATAAAYVCSEVLKSVIDEERPCRAVAGAATSLIACPVNGDWSFPSNHATIAGAAALALALAWSRIWLLTVPMALAMAFSRVFVGVHYPHDVAVGLGSAWSSRCWSSRWAPGPRWRWRSRCVRTTSRPSPGSPAPAHASRPAARSPLSPLVLPLRAPNVPGSDLR